MLFFGLPAILVWSVGLLVCSADGYDGFFATIWDLAWHPSRLKLLSAENMAGLVIIAMGFTIIFIALGTLRLFYSSLLVIREDHQLITRGIYRFMRHPIYTGVIIVAIGVPVYASSLYGFLIMLALIPIFLNRIRMEERLLTDEFGDAYQTYKENTKKLIPFIY